jgi:hypothetical protein
MKRSAKNVSTGQGVATTYWTRGINAPVRQQCARRWVYMCEENGSPEQPSDGTRDCSDCHWYRPEGACFEKCDDCLYDPNHPNWQPMTNYDRVLLMDEDQLVELWSTQKFAEKYQPECAKDGRGCQYWNYTCELCPGTFRNWLRSTDDERDL